MDVEYKITPDTVLRVAEGLDVVILSQDEVLIQFGSKSYPSELLRDHDSKGILGQLIGSLLHQPRELKDILSELRQEDVAGIQEVITDLVNRGILTDINSSPLEQYLNYSNTLAS